MFRPRRHIQIVQHDEDPHIKSTWIWLCCNRLGYRYKISHVRGLGKPIPKADLTFLHVDLTVVPDAYLEALRDHPLVINRNMTDISKRRISDQLLTEGSSYDGEVLVKTNANYGGIPEAREQWLSEQGSAKASWEEMNYLEEYVVFPSIAEVPAGVWRNPRLIAEKFLPEVDDQNRYRLRIWIFMGDREFHYSNYSDQKIIKRSNIDGRDILPTSEVPQELREIRKRLNIEYGKFDYGIHHGKPVLYDVNKTPVGGRLRLTPTIKNHANIIADGIERYF